MASFLSAESVEQARQALEHKRMDILIYFKGERQDELLAPVLTALKEIDEYAPDGRWHYPHHHCPQCGGSLKLKDDKGNENVVSPGAWFTWACSLCEWLAGYAGTPEMADRLLERKVEEAWATYDPQQPSEFPPPT